MFPVVLALACTRPPHYDSWPEDSAEDSAAWVDEDGDGFAPLGVESDPALVDCDDANPEVTPDTERLVPGGSFQMGPPGATREITVSPICAQVHEVRVADFVLFLEDMLAQGFDNVDTRGNTLFDFEDDDDEFPETIVRTEGGFAALEGYEQHPATEVWAHSAEAYCAWAGMRLPTEAEWQKAVRGVEDERAFPWGDAELSCDRANVNTGPEGPEAEFCVGEPLEVGLYEEGVGPHGLYDSVGNVSEWISDWWDPEAYLSGPDTDPTGREDPLTDPHGGSDAPLRATMGGSFASWYIFSNAYEPYPEPEWATSNGVGFRCFREQR